MKDTDKRHTQIPLFGLDQLLSVACIRTNKTLDKNMNQ